MRIELYIKTDVATEPVTSAELAAKVNYGGADATVLAELVSIGKAAREKLEKFTGRNFAEKTMVYITDTITVDRIYLMYGPVNSVDSVASVDEYGVETALVASTDYYVLGDFDKYIRLESFTSGAYLKVTYKSGYKSGAFVLPPSLKNAILVQARHDYDNRSGETQTELSPGALNLCRPFKVYEV